MLFRTDLHGTVQCVCDGQHISITPSRTPVNPEDVYTLSWTASMPDNASPKPEYYVGNTKSYRFHRPICDGLKKMNEANMVTFTTREEAITLGYQPCGSCKP